MLNHEYFNELAALETIGQLSEAEIAEFEDHLGKCASCRSAHADFVGTIQAELPGIDNRGDLTVRLRARVGADRGYRQRFIERARAYGVRFSPEVDQKPGRPSVPFFALFQARISVLVFASLLLVIGAWVYESSLSDRTVVPPDSALQHQIARQAGSNPELRAPVEEISKSEALETAEIQRLKSELAASRGQRVALGRLLERTRKEQLALQEQLGSSEAQAAESESRSEEDARLLGELKNELKTVRASLTDAETIVAAQQERLRDLSEKFAAQTALFEQERELLAAGKEIRDLMSARNLHIIDVFDVDESGKSKRGFGRVFYTEGKSLIFYAFDLASKKPSRVEHAFQAWGYREPTRQPVRSLGIFYADDRTQNRWVLKFDDPEVLAQIDAVFVTVEPRGGSSEPTGQKLLYAYLNGHPNHP